MRSGGTDFEKSKAALTPAMHKQDTSTTPVANPLGMLGDTVERSGTFD